MHDVSITRENVEAGWRTLRTKIKPAADDWLIRNAWRDGKFVRAQLPGLVNFICERWALEIAGIASYFHDYSLYPDLPTVKLYGCDGRGDDVPDVWLLGWRRKGHLPDATSIHDHYDSEVFVRVVKGEVTEIEYEVDPAGWKSGAGIIAIETIKRRKLKAGQTAHISAPYIHRMLEWGTSDGYSVHGYHPPLDQQTSFVKTGDNLERSSSWNETGPSDCA